jgi:hypothetical protein
MEHVIVLNRGNEPFVPIYSMGVIEEKFFDDTIFRCKFPHDEQSLYVESRDVTVSRDDGKMVWTGGTEFRPREDSDVGPFFNVVEMQQGERYVRVGPFCGIAEFTGTTGNVRFVVANNTTMTRVVSVNEVEFIDVETYNEWVEYPLATGRTLLTEDKMRVISRIDSDTQIFSGDWAPYLRDIPIAILAKYKIVRSKRNNEDFLNRLFRGTVLQAMKDRITTDKSSWLKEDQVRLHSFRRSLLDFINGTVLTALYYDPANHPNAPDWFKEFLLESDPKDRIESKIAVSVEGPAYWKRVKRNMITDNWDYLPPSQNNVLQYVVKPNLPYTYKETTDKTSVNGFVLDENKALTHNDLMSVINEQYGMVLSESFSNYLNDIYRGVTSLTVGKTTVDVDVRINASTFPVNQLSYTLIMVKPEVARVGNWFFYEVKTKMVNYTPRGKQPEFSERGSLFKKNRQQMKVGKFFKLLFPTFNDVQIQGMVDRFEGYFNNNINIETDVANIYNHEDITDDGSLGSSCMNGDYDYTRFYDRNKVKIATSFRNGKLIGRALIWEDCYVLKSSNAGIDEGSTITLMDRIYTDKDSLEQSFKLFAKENGFAFKMHQASGEKTKIGFYVDDELMVGHVVVRVKYDDEGPFPYMDTMSFGDPIYLYNEENVNVCYTYHQTDGTRDGDDDEDTVYSEYYDRDIDREDAVWCDRYDTYLYDCDVVELHDGSYVHIDDAYEYNGSHYSIDDDRVTLFDGEWCPENLAMQLHDGKFYPIEDCTEQSCPIEGYDWVYDHHEMTEVHCDDYTFFILTSELSNHETIIFNEETQVYEYQD